LEPVTTAQQPDKGLTTTWLVRKGDTVIKACRETYGKCAPTKLNEVLASNPHIRSRGIIRPGDVIILPKKVAAMRLN
jgi:phage tail protein X